MIKPDVIFVLSVDTEEEWHWNEAFPEDNFSLENVAKLPKFQTFCEQNDIRPTYFVDYAVAANKHARDTLIDIAQAPTSEFGAHLHPWCNPPYYGKTTEFESHVINLPSEQIERKLDTLTECLIKEFGVVPQSFRSGRWGIDGRCLQFLSSRGYKVDSSVYPFYENEYFSCKGSPGVPYWPSFNNPLSGGTQRDIMELPVSAGFNRKHFTLASKIQDYLASPQLNWTKSIGFLWHTHALRKLYLSPELTSAEDMCTLINTCLKNKHPVIHMYLHSSSLIDGVTGLLDKQQAFHLICERINTALGFLKQHTNVTCATISEAAMLIQQTPDLSPLLNWHKDVA